MSFIPICKTPGCHNGEPTNTNAYSCPLKTVKGNHKYVCYRNPKDGILYSPQLSEDLFIEKVKITGINFNNYERTKE